MNAKANSDLGNLYAVYEEYGGLVIREVPILSESAQRFKVERDLAFGCLAWIYKDDSRANRTPEDAITHYINTCEREIDKARDRITNLKSKIVGADSLRRQLEGGR